MKERFLFFEDNCPYCDSYLKVVDDVNSKLEPDDKIILKNISAFMILGMVDDPLIEKYNIDFAPILVLDGKKIIGVASHSKIHSREWISGFLNEYFREEFVA